MKITLDQANHLKSSFLRLASKEDFLTLINLAKKYLSGEPSNPFTLAQLEKYTDSESNSKYYTVFSIKKKSGKDRMIMAPEPELKNVLQCINLILQSTYVPHEAATGFTLNKSIITNARLHIKKNYVFNIDLKDFFHSFSEEKIKSGLSDPPFSFIGDKDFRSSIISKICTHSFNTKNGTVVSVLPQGSPASPVLTNILCLNLDISLFKLAEQYSMVYSRYADDITFSSDNNIFTDETFLLKLNQIIEEYELKINTRKTRLQFKSSRQQATGLVINEKVNVSRKYVKEIRMWLYYWDKYSYTKAQKLFTNDYNTRKRYAKNKKPELVNVLEGKLNFLKMVKGESDTNFLSLKKKFGKLIKNQANPPGVPEEIIEEDTPSLFDYSTLRSKLWRGSFITGASSPKQSLDPNGQVISFHDKESREEVLEKQRVAINKFKEVDSEDRILYPVAIFPAPSEGPYSLTKYKNEGQKLQFIAEENVLNIPGVNLDERFTVGFTIDRGEGNPILFEVRNPNAFKFSSSVKTLIYKLLKTDQGLDPVSEAEIGEGSVSVLNVAKFLSDNRNFRDEDLALVREAVIKDVFGNIKESPESYFNDIINYEQAFNNFQTEVINWYSQGNRNIEELLNQVPNIINNSFDQSTLEYNLTLAEVDNRVSLENNEYPYLTDSLGNQFKNLVFYQEKWYKENDQGEFVEASEILGLTRNFPGLFTSYLGKRPRASELDNFVLTEIINYNGDKTYSPRFLNLGNPSEVTIEIKNIINGFKENGELPDNLSEIGTAIREQIQFSIQGFSLGKPLFYIRKGETQTPYLDVKFSGDQNASYSIVLKDIPEVIDNNTKKPISNFNLYFKKTTPETVMSNLPQATYSKYSKLEYSAILKPKSNIVSKEAPVTTTEEQTSAIESDVKGVTPIKSKKTVDIERAENLIRELDNPEGRKITQMYREEILLIDTVSSKRRKELKKESEDALNKPTSEVALTSANPIVPPLTPSPIPKTQSKPAKYQDLAYGINAPGTYDSYTMNLTTLEEEIQNLGIDDKKQKAILKIIEDLNFIQMQNIIRLIGVEKLKKLNIIREELGIAIVRNKTKEQRDQEIEKFRKGY